MLYLSGLTIALHAQPLSFLVIQTVYYLKSGNCCSLYLQSHQHSLMRQRKLGLHSLPSQCKSEGNSTQEGHKPYRQNASFFCQGDIKLHIRWMMHFWHLGVQLWAVSAGLVCCKKMHPDILSYFVLECNTTATQTLAADSIVWDLADTP